MTAEEWELVATELDHGFQGGFGQSGPDDAAGAAQEAVYRRHLGELEAETVTAAIALVLQDGQEWLPKPGQLLAAVRRLQPGASSVPFAVAWATVQAALRKAYVHPDTGTAEELQRAERLFVQAVDAVAGEAAARWAAARGRRGLGQERVDDQDHGGAVLHRLEQEYARFAAQVQEDGKVGLALQRVGRGELARGPVRLDVSRMIGDGS